MRARVYATVSCMCVVACGSDGSELAGVERDAGPQVEAMRVLPPDEPYAGKSLEAWASDYMRWVYSQTSCDSAAYDRDGSLCGLYQDDESPVFFLERAPYSVGTAPVTQRTECRVPAGKGILVPVALFSIDDAARDEPRTDAELLEITRSVKNSIRNMTLRFDGRAVDDFEDRGIGPIEFEYWVPPAPNYYSCSDAEGIADTVIRPGYLAGYLALFDPPAPGRHEVSFSSVLTYGSRSYAFQVESSFTVADADD